MGHDTLNKKISIPDLPRNPRVWGTPPADMLYNDHEIDPSTDGLRDAWLTEEIDSNPLISPIERDVAETRYGVELDKRASRLGKQASRLSDIDSQDDALDVEDLNRDDEDDE